MRSFVEFVPPAALYFSTYGLGPNRLSRSYDKANVTGDASMRACGANPGQTSFVFYTLALWSSPLYPVLDRTAIFGSIPANINTSPTFLYVSSYIERITALKLGLRVSPVCYRVRGGQRGYSAQIKGSEVAVNRIPAVSWVAQSCFRKISTF
jgi:hypothetical protein